MSTFSQQGGVSSSFTHVKCDLDNSTVERGILLNDTKAEQAVGDLGLPKDEDYNAVDFMNYSDKHFVRISLQNKDQDAAAAGTIVEHAITIPPLGTRRLDYNGEIIKDAKVDVIDDYFAQIAAAPSQNLDPATAAVHVSASSTLTDNVYVLAVFHDA